MNPSRLLSWCRQSSLRLIRHKSTLENVSKGSAVPLYHQYVNDCDEVKMHPMVIIHGLFGSSKNWMSLAKAFSKRMQREVFVVDCRNHGLSPHEDEMDYRVMSKDIAKLLTDENVGPVDMIGHSMGGKVAMMYALSIDLPDLIQKLVVVDTSPDWGRELLDTKFPDYLSAIDNVTMNPRLTLSQVRQSVANQLEPCIKDKGEINFLITNVVKTENGYGWQINIKAIQENLARIVSFPKVQTSFDKGTLFVGGGNSKHIAQRNEPDIMRHFPNAEITYIANAGHWVHADKPYEFLDVVSNYLKDSKVHFSPQADRTKSISNNGE